MFEGNPAGQGGITICDGLGADSAFKLWFALFGGGVCWQL